MKGAVASGHSLTSGAACEMLRRGGNAFDAAVAAGFASVVAEPVLSSLGGGGFLMAHIADRGEDAVYDFFVDAPGRGASFSETPVLEPVEIRFKSTVQVFHIGAASVAAPGMLKGLLRFYREHASMDIRDIIRPALSYLEEGVELDGLQSYLIKILLPILSITDYGKEIFGGKGGGGRLYNPLLGEFLGLRSPDAWIDAFYGSGAQRLEEQLRPGGGRVTARDLREYEVRRREPLSCAYRGFELLFNPPPSFGGALLENAFSLLENQEIERMDEAEACLLLTEIMARMNRERQGAAGTTHVSVVDGAGNAVSMTSSNGSNSGHFLGDTGVMLNNMMGEDDLFPHGFFTTVPGARVGSMMSPTIIKKDGEIHSVLGSGGSKRIKTAMLQVIHNLLDRGMDVARAVEAPRMHLDDEGVLQLEPGFGEDALRAVRGKYPLNPWQEKEVYFGGVHAVTGDLKGWGDTRRGGYFMRVD
jgi:gamma-glutamyltranspeptidase/glutathione hydrolase